jgi:hypothetical protein
LTYVVRTVPAAREHVAWAAGSGWLGQAASSWLLVSAVGSIAFGAIVRFAMARDPFVPGVVALIATRFQHEMFSAVLGVFQQNYYQSGSCLAGWVAGRGAVRIWSRWATRPISDVAAERIAGYGAMGMLSATWVNAGVSKLRESGLGWATSDVLRRMLLAHWQPGHALWREPLFLFVVRHPDVAIAMQVTTLTIELGAILLLVPGLPRILTSLALIAFHVLIFCLSGIHFIEAAALSAVFGFPWVRDERLEPDDAGLPVRSVRLSVAVATAALAILVLLPLPRRDHAVDQHAHEISSARGRGPR